MSRILESEYRFKCDHCGWEDCTSIGWCCGVIRGKEINICPKCSLDIAWERVKEKRKYNA